MGILKDAFRQGQDKARQEAKENRIRIIIGMMKRAKTDSDKQAVKNAMIEQGITVEDLRQAIEKIEKDNEKSR